MTAEQKVQLIARAREVMHNARAPYSRFKVGAAVLGGSGAIHAGCNVENSSYPVGSCAERNAIGAAVAAGEQSITAVAIAATHPDPVPPCGMCRQAINDFGPDVVVICVGATGAEKQYTIHDLLPDAFGEGMLNDRG